MNNLFSNLKIFLMIWAVCLIINQVAFFNASFKLYAIIHAIPHTSIIAFIFTYFYVKNKNNKGRDDNEIIEHGRTTTLQADRSFLTNISPLCPICGTRMVLKTARKGKFMGKSFWGCPHFPTCRGIIDIKKDNP